MLFFDSIEVMEELINTDSEESRMYEIGYLLNPNFSPEKALEAEEKNIRAALSSLGALVISKESPKKINLAYTIEKIIENKKQKFSLAYFGWIKFETDSASILKLKEELDQNENIIRFLLIKTTIEDITSLKSKLPPVVVKKKPEAVKPKKETEATKINKEEIDKKIEQLIVE